MCLNVWQNYLCLAYFVFQRENIQDINFYIYSQCPITTTVVTLTY